MYIGSALYACCQETLVDSACRTPRHCLVIQRSLPWCVCYGFSVDNYYIVRKSHVLMGSGLPGYSDVIADTHDRSWS